MTALRPADVPFFQPAAIRPPPQRAGAAADADEIGELVRSVASWTDAFDPAAVVQLWDRSVAGTSTLRDERMLARVVWHAAFLDTLQDLNAIITSTPAPTRSAGAQTEARRVRRRGPFRRRRPGEAAAARR